ncbi:ATP-binding protein [Aquabacterium sp. A7-Y]|uniref:ATP-binding protein n=1 Tax=Aquabacterium sp. A7-Y TaxID=1349605 RepID=UPI00223D805C|nr:ATP-binding protein [Aquabacterium sp. A7-Y]MCW7540091.1 ATP-binding protein [Aquabacterium sp. A7-Y]
MTYVHESMHMHFARPELASELARQLRGEAAFGGLQNGLFLIAPRGTGTSSFLRLDLEPELARSRAVVVYVDLGADRRRDPAELLVDAVGRALASQLRGLSATIPKARLAALGGALWPALEAGRTGAPEGTTLTDALCALQEICARPVALIVDDAEHALTSEAGERAMAALKQACVQLNAGAHVNLLLVMSGSHRDKLLRLLDASGAPFRGSTIHSLPKLGVAYVEYVVRLIETRRPELRPVNRQALAEAFRAFRQRPAPFFVAVGNALNPMNDSGQRFELQVQAAAVRCQAAEADERETRYLALRPLEQAVLWRLLEQGRRFKIDDAESQAFWATQCPWLPVTAVEVHAALERLREREPPLVWRSARGEYAVEDAAMLVWYQERVRAGQWPPVAPRFGTPAAVRAS